MKVGFSAGAPQQTTASWLLLVVSGTEQLGEHFSELNRILSGALTGVVEQGHFSGRPLELLGLYQRPELAADNLMLCGCGNGQQLAIGGLRRSLSAAFRKIGSSADQRVAVVFDPQLQQHFGLERLVETTTDCLSGLSSCVGLYRNDKKLYPIQELTVCHSDIDAAAEAELTAASERGRIIGDAVGLTREFVNRCPSDLYPEVFVDRVQELASAAGMACTIFDEAALRREKMGALLAVAQGSEHPARMVQLEYRGGSAERPAVTLAGKGVTFDSGGYSLKSTESMLTMKCDMAGAATVIGAGIAAARLKLPINLTIYAGLVENMVSGRSYKLGDVLTARNGTTIEVQNTDAEGRLVLADVLSYAIDQGATRIVDVATLTGACVVALGEDITGLFSESGELSSQLTAAAGDVGEDIWSMPMFAQYDDLLKSDVADIRNVGGRWAGAITAARFLRKFTQDATWAHLDIAGPAFASSGNSWRDSGGTGCMVRTLVRWLQECA